MKKAISSQNTRMYLEDPDSPAVATGSITNASKSNPCVVILDDVSALSNGEPILVVGTGWNSLDNEEWVLQNIDPETKSATLANADTSRETADFNADGSAMWVLHAFADVCAVSYQLNQNAAADIDTTTMCDDEKTSLVGFTDPGTLTFDFFIDPTDPDYLVLVQAQKEGDVRMFIIVYRNGAVRTVPVIVQQVNESGGVDQAVQGSCTMKVAGAPVLTMPQEDVTADYVLIGIASPISGTAPLDVTLLLNESGGTATEYEIDWGDGSDPETVTDTSADHTYEEAGSYTPSVTATVGGMPAGPYRSQTTVIVDDGSTT